MAASANVEMQRRTADRTSYDVAASTHLYDNQFVFVDSNGRATGSTNSGANRFGGIVVAEQDNSGGAAGDLSVETYISGAFRLTGSGFAADDVGKAVYSSDSNTITLTKDGNVYIGRIIEYVSATVVWVKLELSLDCAWIPAGAAQTLAAGGGAVNVTSYMTRGASDAGGDAWTLADGIRDGQLKKIQLTTDGGGDATLTPSNFADGTTITFADVGDFVVLMWNAGEWHVIESGNDADGTTAPVVA